MSSIAESSTPYFVVGTVTKGNWCLRATLRAITFACLLVSLIQYGAGTNFRPLLVVLSVFLVAGHLVLVVRVFIDRSNLSWYAFALQATLFDVLLLGLYLWGRFDPAAEAKHEQCTYVHAFTHVAGFWVVYNTATLAAIYGHGGGDDPLFRNKWLRWLLFRFDSDAVIRDSQESMTRMDVGHRPALAQLGMQEIHEAGYADQNFLSI